MNIMQKLYIGSNLIRYRNAKGLSQADLENATNISQSQISRIESNKQSASVEQIERFSEALGVETDLLKQTDNSIILNIEHQSGGNSHNYYVNNQSAEALDVYREYIAALQTQLADLKTLYQETKTEAADLKAQLWKFLIKE